MRSISSQTENQRGNTILNLFFFFLIMVNLHRKMLNLRLGETNVQK
jgi:hypothetical protein